MTKLKQSVIIIFLGLFVLVKLNPDYVKAQCLPASPGITAIHSIRSVKSGTAGACLLKVDKCIADDEPLTAVPGIKFSGTIFGSNFSENMIPLHDETEWVDLACPVHHTCDFVFQRCLRL